ncbi:MAG: hypothetical protein ACD_82C00071G0002 [uncultured bacterium]|nr:MAG: hypothetical protein ACD_82C00071G0002 [uncultured bacterium]KKP29398.1 MAG: Signal recognition particle receptor FtsY [candidate division TM6 bacterium GW2011_GWF2_30_66]
MFSFIKDKLKKIYAQVTSNIANLLSLKKIDEQSLKELEEILLSADTGVKTTKIIIDNLKTKFKNGQISEGQDLKVALEQELLDLLNIEQQDFGNKVYVLVGINGSGKTTFSGKLANKFKKEGKKVLLVAADTFRAAATEQLENWSKAIGVEVITGSQDQDPASVVFKGCQEFKNGNFDVLIIDTAGRLQTKINLMLELEKIKKTINRHFPEEKINTLLTIDSMLGQNSLEQARIFNESTKVSGIVLTKMDGTGKGGIIFAITAQLGIPVEFISFGENLDNLKEFDKKEYISELLG